MRRRHDSERLGPTPPLHLVEFTPSDWPGDSDADCYDVFTAARDAWSEKHPDGELPSPPDAPWRSV